MLIKRKREFFYINIKVDFRLRALPEIKMLQEVDRFQDPKLGSCLTLRNELSEETRADKARDFIGKGRPGQSSSVRGPGEQLCCGACIPGFYGDGISFQVVLSQSFWLVQPVHACSVKMDARKKDSGRWLVVSPFDLSWTLPVGGGLLVLCSLPGPPGVKQLMQIVTVVPGQGGRFQSSFVRLPLTKRAF